MITVLADLCLPPAPRRSSLAPKAPPTLPGITTAYENFTTSVEKYPDNNCLGHYEDGGFKWLTYKQAGEQVDAIGSALAKVGIAPHSRCGIFGANSPQWMIAMQVGEGGLCGCLHNISMTFSQCHCVAQLMLLLWHGLQTCSWLFSLGRDRAALLPPSVSL